MSLDRAEEQEIIDRFHLLWYEEHQRSTWRNTTWLGRELQQCPADLWVYQELIHRVRPAVFVEIGVKRGGLTHYLASLYDLMLGNDLSTGHVIGVDIGIKSAREAVGSHPRVSLVEGSSTDRRTFERVQDLCAGKRAMVLLVSEHTEQPRARGTRPLPRVGSHRLLHHRQRHEHRRTSSARVEGLKPMGRGARLHRRAFRVRDRSRLRKAYAHAVPGRVPSTGWLGAPHGRRTSMACSVPGSHSWNGRRSVARSSVTARTTPGVRADP